MAGGHTKFRHLSRKSSARIALLRSQVTALVMHEHIQTTYAKAKESQRMAEKLITLAKRDTPTSRKQVQAMLYVRAPWPGGSRRGSPPPPLDEGDMVQIGCGSD